MSAIPELDRLIDEAENIKRNNEWARIDRFFRRSMGCAFISMLVMPVLGILFDKIGVAVALMALIGLLVFVLPVLALGVYTVLHECFTDPPPRDPTKRYKHM